MMNRRSRNNNRGASNTSHRGGGGGSGVSRSHVFDSNGPEVRIRGTAFQVHEKYMALAKDASSIGDRILAENYLQHAEHYQRIIGGWMEADAPSVSSDTVDRAVESPSGAYASDAPQPSQQHVRRHDRPAGGDRPVHRPQYQPARPAASSPQREADLGLPPSILGMKPVQSASDDVAQRSQAQRDEFAGA